MNKLLALVCCIMLVFASCSKETKPEPQAQIKFINASVNTVTAQTFFDEILLVNNIGFPEASGYYFINVGMPTIKVVSATSNTTSYTITGTASFDNNTNYTLIAADSASKMKLSVVKDDITSPATGKASIRFFNLVGNATSSISLDTSLVTTTGGTLFTRSFNDQTSSAAASFVTVNAGSYTIKIKNTTTSSVLATKVINLESGRIYTLAATGTIGASTAPQAVGISVFPYN
jgi:hypothetical protein